MRFFSRFLLAPISIGLAACASPTVSPTPLLALHMPSDTLTGLIGRVTAGSGAPVAKATDVLYSATSNTATIPVRTDRYGRFAIGPIRPDAYTLQAKASGYNPALRPAELTAGRVDTLLVCLEPSTSVGAGTCPAAVISSESP